STPTAAGPSRRNSTAARQPWNMFPIILIPPPRFISSGVATRSSRYPKIIPARGLPVLLPSLFGSESDRLGENNWSVTQFDDERQSGLQRELSNLYRHRS